jgi:hypothetical protein
MGAEGTIVCPLEAKKSRYFCLISLDVIINIIIAYKVKHFHVNILNGGTECAISGKLRIFADCGRKVR